MENKKPGIFSPSLTPFPQFKKNEPDYESTLSAKMKDRYLCWKAANNLTLPMKEVYNQYTFHTNQVLFQLGMLI